MFAISGDELEKCPPIPQSVYCPECKQWHEVEDYGIIASCKCGDSSYLVGLKGRMVNQKFLIEEPIDES